MSCTPNLWTEILTSWGSLSGSLVNHVLDDITRVPVVLMANVSDKAEAAVSRGEVVQESLLICNPGSRRWE